MFFWRLGPPPSVYGPRGLRMAPQESVFANVAIDKPLVQFTYRNFHHLHYYYRALRAKLIKSSNAKTAQDT